MDVKFRGLNAAEWLECRTRCKTAARAMAIRCIEKFVSDGVVHTPAKALTGKTPGGVKFINHSLLALENRLPFFEEGRHSLFLIFKREERMDGLALESEAF